MTRPRTGLAALSLLLVAGCAGSGSAPGAQGDAALADLWASFGDTYGCVDNARFGTIRDFGVRHLACTVASAYALTSIPERAPVAPFRSGPHDVSAASVSLDLSAGRDFGRYDPAFVRWVTDAAVVEGAVARQLVAPAYRDYVARPARLYWLGLRALEAVGFPEALPPGKLADYAAFLDGGPVTDAIQGFDGGETVSTYDFIDSLPPLVAEGEVVVTVRGADYDLVDWPLREEASAGVAFWIRRDADGTADEWRSGLRGLLAAYDADWLASHGG